MRHLIVLVGLIVVNLLSSAPARADDKDHKHKHKNLAELQIAQQQAQLDRIHKRIEHRLEHNFRGHGFDKSPFFSAHPFGHHKPHWTWGKDWSHVRGNHELKHLWFGPAKWHFGGSHGSVLIDVGGGWTWWGAPDIGWHRAYRHNNLFWVHDWHAPVADRRFIVYDPRYRYWHPGYYYTPFAMPAGYVDDRRYDNRVDADAYKMFIPIDEYKKRQEASGKAQARVPASDAAEAKVKQPDIPAETRGKMLKKTLEGGRDLMKRGEYANAAAYFSLALHIDSKSTEARRLLVLALTATQQFEKAAEHVKALVEQARNQREVIEPTAGLFKEPDELDRQLQALRQKTGTGDPSPELRLLQGFLLTTAGRQKEAAQVLQNLGDTKEAQRLLEWAEAQ